MRSGALAAAPPASSHARPSLSAWALAAAWPGTGARSSACEAVLCFAGAMTPALGTAAFGTKLHVLQTCAGFCSCSGRCRRSPSLFNLGTHLPRLLVLGLILAVQAQVLLRRRLRGIALAIDHSGNLLFSRVEQLIEGPFVSGLCLRLRQLSCQCRTVVLKPLL